MQDKNLAQALLHDAGRPMYKKEQLRDMSDAQIRRAGLKNVASFAVSAVATIGLTTYGAEKFHDMYTGSTMPAQVETEPDSKSRSSAPVVGEMPAAQVPEIELANTVAVEMPPQEQR